jgi:hypothetical protein
MSGNRLSAILARYLGGMGLRNKPISVEQRARDLIAAIDAGGLPLNPFIVNDIARQMGLDVAANAPMSGTISRIRRALE